MGFESYEERMRLDAEERESKLEQRIEELEAQTEWDATTKRQRDGLKAQLERLEKAAQDLLDATGHSTWSKLFKAPEVETAIRNMKQALESDSEG